MFSGNDTQQAGGSGGGNTVDETSRSFYQLLQLLLRLSQQYQHNFPRGLKLSRTEYKEFQRQLEEHIRLAQFEQATTIAWYEARVADYQRESADIAARAAAGTLSDEERLKATAYMQGKRAEIESTIHATSLTPEQRGQVVQRLDAVDADPRVRMQHGVFGPMTRKEKAVARGRAAQSEAETIEHQDQRAAREAATAQPDTPAGLGPAVTAFLKANAVLQQQVQTLTAENGALTQQVEQLQAQVTATAATNGHAPRPQQQAEQDAATAEAEQGPGMPPEGGNAAQMQAEA
ncbi:hypothetical protein LTV02_17960 [Nocardia yamanashiensis]|uniref:hypothetical protein n=1 Tax=Nocardia yamanashiensis TaxID=209247 RepID=UPI001E3ADC24|nr:hypothetical protein [Nocardia yamanashiensis]UGT45157.1 hypothetical protein LTV02_17960 [Nocardia yamanashiensis]